jgi:hypothetical protein
MIITPAGRYEGGPECRYGTAGCSPIGKLRRL